MLPFLLLTGLWLAPASVPASLPVVVNPPAPPAAHVVAHTTSLGALGGVFWSVATDCSNVTDDLLRRQCQGLTQASRIDPHQIYAITVEPGAVTASDWDDALEEISLVVHGCVACATPVDVGGGQRRHVVTNGNVAVVGDAVLGPEITHLPRRFATAEDAEAWKKSVLPRLRTTILFSVPAQPKGWTQGGKQGVFVDLAGYIVADPCSGQVIASNPPVAQVKSDASTCPGGEDEDWALGTASSRPVPEELDFNEIQETMTAAQPTVRICHERYGVPGNANVYVELAPDGVVKYVEVRGEFADTPTGACVQAAVKKIKFPPFKRALMRINYSFVLR